MWRWASDISWSRLKWQYPVINEPKCLFFFFVVVFFFFFFFWWWWGWGRELDYFLFQLLSGLCFPTSWLFTFSKVGFKFSDQASMNYRYPQVASVRLLFFVSIHSYYRDQRRSDCRLVMLYKVTYDRVAIPASDYLTTTVGSPNISTLAYRQIPTLKSYDKYTFFPRTIIHWNALPAFIPLLPTLAQFSNAVCQVVHLPPKYQICFYLLTKLIFFFALYKLISPTLHIFYSINPLHHLLYRNPIWCPPRKLDVLAERKKDNCIINAHVSNL